jgi:hypothetical protein
VIGTTFEGTVYDENNQTNLTGTFLPAYGINGIFGDIPILGAFLGGGENGGLIGVTYRLRGDLKSPQLSVNPLSAIAPGMFRKIFAVLGHNCDLSCLLFSGPQGYVLRSQRRGVNELSQRTGSFPHSR